ncbi:MAG: thiamine phosphate synthase, partial [Muribaculaceae bacterium]|nr:thiamine phosphate synthase [Muribaculaceae bacterium]
KANLSPVLGLEGYKDIVAKYRERGGELPIVAIGGIEFDDIHPLMATGVSGIAVSSAIANAADVTAETQRFIEQLEKYKI